MEKIAKFLNQASKYTQGFDKEYREKNEGAIEMEALFHKYDVPVAEFTSKTKYQRYIDKLKKISILTNTDKFVLNELERHIYDFSLDDSNDWVKIKINNTPWYVKKIDSTHLYFSNDMKKEGIAMHVGQFIERPFYKDLQQWLHGRLNIQNKSYKE